MLILKDEDVLTYLNQIDDAIRYTEYLRATLTAKRAKLTEHLETCTRPALVAAPVVQPKRPGVTYCGKSFTCRNTVQLHATILRQLWKDFPEQREAMAGAMSTCGYSRKYVARSRENLFDGFKSPGWVRRYSADLIDGWYVDTNMSSQDLIKRVLTRAMNIVGLKWGVDIQVVWKNS